MKNVNTRARFVANIFDILAWVVLGIGAFFAAIAFLAGLFGTMGDEWINSFAWGVGLTLSIGVYTAVTWASIALASIIAGYIEQKS
jgi:hypothetical protein